MLRWAVSLSPFLHLALMYGFHLVAWNRAGHAPDANLLPLSSICGGAGVWAGVVLQLTMILGLAFAIGCGVKGKEWRWLGILAAGWAFWITLIVWDPIGARAWFLY